MQYLCSQPRLWLWVTWVYRNKDGYDTRPKVSNPMWLALRDDSPPTIPASHEMRFAISGQVLHEVDATTNRRAQQQEQWTSPSEGG